MAKSRSRSVYNYIGTVAVTIYTFYAPPNALLTSLWMQASSIVGAQIIPVLFMVLPKLWVDDSKDKTGQRDSTATIRREIMVVVPEPAVLHIDTRARDTVAAIEEE